MKPLPHAPAHILPLLRRMDANFGGAWSREDIDTRSREWARQLAAVPLAAVTSAVDYLIGHHEGHYPKVAQVRRVAMDMANRNGILPEREADESCPRCGATPQWHRVLVNGTPMERHVYRHAVDQPCSRFNAEHRFVDTTEMESAA